LQPALRRERFLCKWEQQNGKESGIGNGRDGRPGHGNLQGFCRDGYKVVAAYSPEFDNKDEWLKEMEAAGYKDFVCVSGDVTKLRRLPGDGRRSSRAKAVPSTSW
jgi:hypothetical protein